LKKTETPENPANELGQPLENSENSGIGANEPVSDNVEKSPDISAPAVSDETEQSDGAIAGAASVETRETEKTENQSEIVPTSDAEPAVEEAKKKPHKDKVAPSKLLSKKQWQIVALSFIVLFIFFIYLFFFPFVSGGERILYEIKPGTPYSVVISDLTNKGIIKSPALAKIAGFLLGADKKLKSGAYEIPKEISYTSLMMMLISNDRIKPKELGLYRGITIKAVGNIVQQIKLPAAEKFRKLLFDSVYAASYGIEGKNFEGYLLPVPYKVLSTDTPENIIDSLFKLQAALFTKQVMDDIEKQGMTKHQILTLASIIDREAKYFDEMPRISGVYHNRLKKKMKLQADPTVQYALDEPRSRITAEDLKVESPYNTYKYAGLPPGPIGNPSKEAILAAIYPEQNEYLFFVSNTKGRHIFTKTYEEHKFYAKRYREWLDSLKISR